MAATRRGGIVSIPGVYAGFIHGFLIGDAFDKGLTFRMGNTHVQHHLPRLLEHLQNGELHPQAIITHHMQLAEAERAYDIFDKHEEECRKVVPGPAADAPNLPRTAASTSDNLPCSVRMQKSPSACAASRAYFASAA
jgi:hypothetical protein